MLRLLLVRLVCLVNVNSVVQSVPENRNVHLLEAAERVHRATISFRSLEEILSSRVESLVRVFPWATTTSSTRRGISQFTVRSFRVFLLHMCVESRVRKICLLAVLALKVSSLIVVLRPPLANLSRAVGVFIFVVCVVRVFQIILTLILILIVIHLA